MINKFAKCQTTEQKKTNKNISKNIKFVKGSFLFSFIGGTFILMGFPNSAVHIHHLFNGTLLIRIKQHMNSFSQIIQWETNLHAHLCFVKTTFPGRPVGTLRA